MLFIKGKIFMNVINGGYTYPKVGEELPSAIDDGGSPHGGAYSTGMM
jgi:hypothetical protein